MSTTNHTPLPWVAGKDIEYGLAINGPTSDSWGYPELVGMTCMLVGWDIEEQKARRLANREFIIKACNAHYQLVNYCLELLDAVDDPKKNSKSQKDLISECDKFMTEVTGMITIKEDAAEVEASTEGGAT